MHIQQGKYTFTKSPEIGIWPIRSSPSYRIFLWLCAIGAKGAWDNKCNTMKWYWVQYASLQCLSLWVFRSSASMTWLCKSSASALREQLEDNVPRLVGICHTPSCLYLVITSGHSIFFNSKSSDNDAVDADTTKMKTIMILIHAMETCLQAGFEVVRVWGSHECLCLCLCLWTSGDRQAGYEGHASVMSLPICWPSLLVHHNPLPDKCQAIRGEAPCHHWHGHWAMSKSKLFLCGAILR